MDRRRLLIVTAALPAAAVLTRAQNAWANNDPPRPVPGPPLSIGVEPIEASDAVYLPLAPPTQNDVESAKLILRLLLKNNGAGSHTITGISFSFPGSGISPKVMQGVDLVLGDGGVLTAGQQKWWSNGSVQLDENTKVKNQVYLDLPVPTSVRVNVFVAGYVYPATVTLPLAPYQIGHRLPFDINDLRPGECISAIGDHWANGGAPGSQIYAHDVGVLGWDDNLNDWTALLPASVGKATADQLPQDFRAWDLPIHAVADGTVIDTHDGMDDNTVIGQFPDPTPSPGGGNYVWIAHADGTRTYYPHMRKNSLTVANGQSVTAGQIIGHLGNSGNTTGPHIHIEVRKYVATNPLRPWVLRDAWLVERAANTPWNPQSPLWVNGDGYGIPNKDMLIWPSSLPPVWYRPNLHDYIEYDWPPHHWNELLDRATVSGYQPVALSAYEVAGKVWGCAAIRPATRYAVKVSFALAAKDFLAESESLRRAGFRPIALASHVDGDPRYTAIWSAQDGPAWTWYQGVGADDHLHQMEALTGQGYRPVCVSAAAPGGKPELSALYVQDRSAFSAVTLVPGDDLERAVADNARAGRQLAHLSAVAVDRRPLFCAVFLPGTAETRFRHGMSSAELFAELDATRDTRFVVQALAGYELDGRPAFTALWNQ
jgi:hypothetical protein